jgi:hypothetical protein
MTDCLGTTSFSLDLLDLLGRIAQVNSFSNHYIQYECDSVGNKIKIQYPDSSQALNAFDSMKRFASVIDGQNVPRASQLLNLERVS